MVEPNSHNVFAELVLTQPRSKHLKLKLIPALVLSKKPYPFISRNICSLVLNLRR
jgi:hypothetical protein